MNVMEFVVRMKDEAAGKLASLRSQIRGTGTDSKKTIPELGDMGSKVSEVAGGFARAREAMMKVVGLGGMIAGSFMAAYRTAQPLGEYIRRMWDPVERGANNFKRMQDQLEKSAAATQQKLEAQRAAVQAIADQYDKAIDGASRYYDSLRKANNAESTALSPAESDVNARQASNLAMDRQAQQMVLSQKLREAQGRQKENAANFPKQMTDPEQLQRFLTSNGLIKAEIEDIEKALQKSVEDAAYAAQDLNTAMRESFQARVNEAREEVQLQQEVINKKREKMTTERLESLEKIRDKVSDRLGLAQDLKQRAIDEYRDPTKRAERLAAESEEKKSKDQLEKDRKALVNKYGISIWGVKKLDESRFGRGVVEGMSDREKSVLEVIRATDKKTSDEQTLKSIDSEMKGLRKELQANLRVK